LRTASPHQGVGVSEGGGSGVLLAVSVGVSEGVSDGVRVGVSVGNGVKVWVAVGGAKVGVCESEDRVGLVVTDGGGATVIVGLGVGLTVAVGDAVKALGALRMATMPAQ
jgi:hypothetical protein